jgi:hypothetical protein
MLIALPLMDATRRPREYFNPSFRAMVCWHENGGESERCGGRANEVLQKIGNLAFVQAAEAELHR